MEEKDSAERDFHQKAVKKLAQANSKIVEVEAKLMSLQKKLLVLLLQDKRKLINQGDPYNFSDSESEPTSSRFSQKRKKREVFPPSIQYGGFFPDDASILVPVDEQMLTLLASTQAVGSLITLLQETPHALRITPP